jgi:hypothetical protein
MRRCGLVFVVTTVLAAASAGPALGLSAGDTVRTTANVNVRTAPSIYSPEIAATGYPGYAPRGTVGTVLEEPVLAGGQTWFKVNYGPGLYTGWSVSEGLAKAVAAPAADAEPTVPEPTPTKTSTGPTKVATPTLDPPPGAFQGSVKVTLSCATPGAAIYYTTDGTDPVTSSPPYAAPLTLVRTTALKARAVKVGLADSDVTGGMYSLISSPPPSSPSATPSAGSVVKRTPKAKLSPPADESGKPQQEPFKAKELQVPWIKQDSGSGCARACALMLLQYYSISVVPATAKEHIPDNAHISDDVVPGLSKLSSGKIQGKILRTDGEHFVDDLISEIGQGRPVIVLVAQPEKLPWWKTNSIPHYLVVTGVRPDASFVLNDPLYGKQVASKQEMEKAWGSTRPPNVNFPWQGVKIDIRFVPTMEVAPLPSPAPSAPSTAFPSPPAPSEIQPEAPSQPAAPSATPSPPSAAAPEATLTLYVREGKRTGPVLEGARVTGEDAAGKAFDATTGSDGRVILTGTPGTWRFTASRDGYETASWTQPIRVDMTRQAYLKRVVQATPTSPQPTGADAVPSPAPQPPASPTTVPATVTRPSPPVARLPGTTSTRGEVLNTLTPTLRWDAAAGADYYALAISKEPYGTANVIHNPQRVTGTSYQVPSGILQPGQKYRWNLQAVNSAGLSPVSNTLYFQPAAPAAPPAPVAVTLMLYVREGSATGPILRGARVTGQDAAGKAFDATTETTGRVRLTGTPGTWRFTASRDGYETVSWTQSITEDVTRQAYLAPLASSKPSAVPPSAPVAALVVTGVEPSQPVAKSSRQRLAVLGSGFVAGSQVILRIQGSVYPIPADRTQFVSSSRIVVLVGLTEPGTWSVQVVNPGNVASAVVPFQVLAKAK